MILCGYMTDVGGEGVREGGGCSPRKDIRRRKGRAGREKNINKLQ